MHMMDNCDISTAYTSKNWKCSVKNREFHLKHILLYSINNTIANTKPLKMMTSTGLVANNSLPPCLSPFFSISPCISILTSLSAKDMHLKNIQ